jgi:3-hydroxyacyl-[acyl-carrier-protein] dehydratase
MVTDFSHIIQKLPYEKPFLFVDEITHVNEDSVEGNFTFNENLDFYRGHFKGNPVTPGVILTETMAQIGVACLGIYLLGNSINEQTKIAMSSIEVEFIKPVFPGEKVTVLSKTIYFRFGKLKCTVSMRNAAGEEVCHGTIAGVITD